MTDDYPVYVNGRVMSAKQYRVAQRLARELRQLQSEIAAIEAGIWAERERQMEAMFAWARDER